MADENAEKRARAADTGMVHELYGAVIGSLEPNITAIDGNAFYASAAISLKRIADVMELVAISLMRDHAERERDMRSWAERHGFKDLMP